MPYTLSNADNMIHTRSPMRAGSTFAPTISMTPDPSWWGIWKSAISRAVDPARVLTSVGLMPEKASFTRT